MMLEQIVRSFVPVEAFSKERVTREVVVQPEVGRRWGKPAQLQWSATGKQSDTPSRPQHIVRDDEVTYRQLQTSSLDIDYQRVFHRDPDTGRQVRVRRVRRLSFRYTLQERPEGVLTTSAHVIGVSLSLKLHPDEADA